MYSGIFLKIISGSAGVCKCGTAAACTGAVDSCKSY